MLVLIELCTCCYAILVIQFLFFCIKLLNKIYVFIFSDIVVMMENKQDMVVLEFDLPEFSEDEISVKVYDDKVDISAKKKEENRLEEEDFKWFEKSSRTFDYSSSLPPVKGKEAEVDFAKGRLKVSVPKK